MRQSLNFLPLILNCAAFCAAIWIVVPAPAYNVWLFSVAASEWSLWLGAAALPGIIFSLLIYVFNGKEKLQILSIIVGCVALVISLYPFSSVVSIAGEKNISLSLKRYFSGLRGANDSSGAANFSTYTFAQIDGLDLKLDVYLPTAISENNGASVIVIHGGSWRSGERNDFPQWNRWLASEGYTVFDVDYRLAPTNYLTATGDVKCAVRWAKTHATEFKISPERIALLGRSAGAHLALLAAYSAGDRRLPATCEDTNQTETIRAVISFYAPVDLIWDYDNPANESVINGPATLSRFVGGSPNDSAEIRDRYVLASPTAHVSSAQTPPTLLIHGGHDQLVRIENLQILDARLNEARAAHRTLFIPYAQHGFDYNFNGFGSQIAQPEMLDFLNANTR